MKNLKTIGSNCDTCSACCTSERSEKYRTPLFESDNKANKRVPTYEFNSQRGCYSCRHLSDEGRCQVYEFRPLICSLYPLYPLLINGEYRLGLAMATFCGYGKELYQEILNGNEVIIEELREKKAEMISLIKPNEFKVFTDQLLSTYKTITVLNI